MTVLARSGVPGLTLWVLTGVAWFTRLMHAQIIARRHGDTQWANLFLWIACYGLAIVIDASFDVALEGPMLGIWFWSLFGLGTASTMVYRMRLSTGSVMPLLYPPPSSDPHGSAQSAYERPPKGRP
jgi:hypothetical protein